MSKSCARLVLGISLALMLTHTTAGQVPAGASVESNFDQSNELAKSGQCERAIESYERIAEVNANNADVHVNLAHCWTTLGKYGRAIWQLELAHRLAPTDQSIAQTLQQLQEQLAHQRVEREGEVRIATAPLLYAWSAYFPRDTLAIVLLLGSWCTLGSALLLFFSRSERVRSLRVAFVISAGAALVSLALLLFHHEWLERHPIAVVLDDEIALYAGPDENAQAGGKLREGEYLRIMDQYQSWVRVEGPAAQQGWILRQHLGVID